MAWSSESESFPPDRQTRMRSLSRTISKSSIACKHMYVCCVLLERQRSEFLLCSNMRPKLSSSLQIQKNNSIRFGCVRHLQWIWNTWQFWVEQPEAGEEVLELWKGDPVFVREVFSVLMKVSDSLFVAERYVCLHKNKEKFNLSSVTWAVARVKRSAVFTQVTSHLTFDWNWHWGPMKTMVNSNETCKYASAACPATTMWFLAQFCKATWDLGVKQPRLIWFEKTLGLIFLPCFPPPHPDYRASRLISARYTWRTHPNFWHWILGTYVLCTGEYGNAHWSGSDTCVIGLKICFGGQCHLYFTADAAISCFELSGFLGTKHTLFSQTNFLRLSSGWCALSWFSPESLQNCSVSLERWQFDEGNLTTLLSSSVRSLCSFSWGRFTGALANFSVAETELVPSPFSAWSVLFSKLVASPVWFLSNPADRVEMSPSLKTCRLLLSVKVCLLLSKGNGVDRSVAIRRATGASLGYVIGVKGGFTCPLLLPLPLRILYDSLGRTNQRKCLHFSSNISLWSPSWTRTCAEVKTNTNLTRAKRLAPKLVRRSTLTPQILSVQQQHRVSVWTTFFVSFFSAVLFLPSSCHEISGQQRTGSPVAKQREQHFAWSFMLAKRSLICLLKNLAAAHLVAAGQWAIHRTRRVLPPHFSRFVRYVPEPLSILEYLNHAMKVNEETEATRFVLFSPKLGFSGSISTQTWWFRCLHSPVSGLNLYWKKKPNWEKRPPTDTHQGHTVHICLQLSPPSKQLDTPEVVVSSRAQPPSLQRQSRNQQLRRSWRTANWGDRNLACKPKTIFHDSHSFFVQKSLE